jgi:cytochrome c oxidase cbb3-type subunit III
MPTKPEKDTAGDTLIRSHEWDGIQEMDNPLPRWWLYVFYASIAVSLLYFVLYPAIPFLHSHTTGLLGYTSRKALDEEMEKAKAAQATYIHQIQAKTPAEIRSDTNLLNFALAGGKAAFGVNCAPCHGAGGAGRPGFPSLADDDWLWGGTLDAIQQTVRHGIRWQADETTRQSEMPRFGADAMLKPDQIGDVAQYVLSLTNRATDAAAAKKGAAVFAEQCAVCHGPKGQGNQELGAPSLTDAVWLYGSSLQDILHQVNAPRLGVMPAWQGRLDDATIKMLTVYVHSLGGGK